MGEWVSGTSISIMIADKVKEIIALQPSREKGFALVTNVQLTFKSVMDAKEYRHNYSRKARGQYPGPRDRPTFQKQEDWTLAEKAVFAGHLSKP